MVLNGPDVVVTALVTDGSNEVVGVVYVDFPGHEAVSTVDGIIRAHGHGLEH